MTKPTITDLIPDDQNTNRHTERGTGLTRKSVDKFGPRKPLELDKNGRIIDGNSRQEIYADVDLNDLEIIDHKPGRVVAIRYPDFDLSDPANPAREYQVAQAQSGKVSLDFDPVAMQWHEEQGAGVKDWFFDWEWEEMTAGENEQPESHDAEGQVNRADELQEIWQVETGQLWRLPSRTAGQEHRLICGDCTDRDVVERVMGGEREYFLLADAPYGMHLDTNYADRLPGERATAKNYQKVIGDHREFDPRPVMQLFLCQEQFWFGADYYAERIPNKNNGSWFVWDKRPGMEDARFTLSEFETIWSKSRHARRILRYRWMGVHGMEVQDTNERVHPTQKPIGLIEELIREAKSVIVADPFCGSGTTIIAAENLGRQCRAIEIAPAYCAVILQRYRDAFGIEPELIPSPEQRP